MKSTIRLFKSLPIKEKKQKINQKIMEKTIKLGFVFAPEVMANYSNYDELIKLVEKSIGISANKLNNSFHKSWKKIREASIEQLVIEQLIHYFTTYGFERIGIYSPESVYIPAEKLEIPELKDSLELVVIKGLTKEEIKEKLLNLLATGIALNEDTLKDVFDIITFVELTEDDVATIKNKEVKAAVYDYLGLFPENPVEFLRFVVYKIVNKTLLIKNIALFCELKTIDNLGIIKLFNEYDKKYGLKRLAEIFYRFKPLFLGLRTNKKMKSTINRLRKLAVKYHKPMAEDYLNCLTAKIKNGEEINEEKLLRELKKVNVFRKIRLAYALKFRTKDVDSILYRVRNGKSYATDFSFDEQDKAEAVLKIVLKNIAENLSKNVKGKKVYLPDYINYSLPATEKMFSGYFPAGTFVAIPKDMVVGVHWVNTDKRVDLDLSLVNAEGKIGWDDNYRTSSGDILFSGDMTDAIKPEGATELFYVQRQANKSLLLFLNYFNFDKGDEVSFKIVVAKERVEDFDKNYMVNPNNVVAVAESKINQKQKMLGLVSVKKDENRFYFAEAYLGNKISSSDSEFSEQAREYLFNFYENSISLKEVLELAGAKLVKDKDKDKVDFDLSPQKLEKDTIINLLKLNYD